MLSYTERGERKHMQLTALHISYLLFLRKFEKYQLHNICLIILYFFKTYIYNLINKHILTDKFIYLVVFLQISTMSNIRETGLQKDKDNKDVEKIAISPIASLLVNV